MFSFLLRDSYLSPSPFRQRPCFQFVLLWIMAGALLITQPVAADPLPNTVGLFLDFEGTVDRIQVPTGEPFSVHLIIRQPTPCDPNANFSWCWGCRVAPSRNIQILNWGDHLCGDNAVTPPDYFVCCPGSFPVDLPSVRLATISALVTDTQTGFFYIRSFYSDGLMIEPFYSTWDGITLPLCFNWLHPSSGSFEIPVFVVNGSEPQPCETTTWSSLKALYY